VPNCNSQTAKKINDQYFTPVSTATWCLERLLELGWDLKGMALEPCVGPGSFVKASGDLGLVLEWVTNDLFPQSDFTPDTELDARDLNPGFKPDFVITNPPFGQSNSLARQILSHSLNLCDQVAMILPKGARRIGFLDAQPAHAHLVLDVNLPNEYYNLPDGTKKQVSTCLQVWERGDTPRQKNCDILDLRKDLITYLSADRPTFVEGDFQVCRWGASMGRVRNEIKQSGSWVTVKVQPGFTVEQVQEVIAAVDVSDYLDKGTAAPAFDVPVWLHRVNTEAVRRGLLVPVDKAAQDPLINPSRYGILLV